MCYQISRIDFSDYKMLREQLTGVDAMYFHQLMNLLEEKREKAGLIAGASDIDGSYLIQLIDQVFEA
jgi:hypothetical protein